MKELEYMGYFQQIVNSHLSLVKSFVSDKQIQDLAIQYQENQESFLDNQFNVFTLVSDLYYRENFHSDVIKDFLDPHGSHKQGGVFLYAFIDFLNDKFNKNILRSNYSSVKVEREQARIDILIKSEESKHCIFIENKINNASDMPKQLPRYYRDMIKDGYMVDAIVYLPLNNDKQPNRSDWSEEDEKHIVPLLCIVPAYRKNEICLVEGWLLPCSTKTNNIDCVAILRQYSELIKLLSHNNMDNVILEKFYNSLLEGDNLKTALSIKNMLSDLPVYMKDRLIVKFKEKGLTKGVWSWKDRHCGLIYDDGIQYKVDIWITNKPGYAIQVFAQGKPALIQTPLLTTFTLNKKDKRWDKDCYNLFDEDKLVEEAYNIFKDIIDRVSSGQEMFQPE